MVFVSAPLIPQLRDRLLLDNHGGEDFEVGFGQFTCLTARLERRP